jgi:hypothetical protein
MACLTEKIGLGGSLAGLAASGVIAVIGAPTVVLSVAGAGAAIGAILGTIAAMRALQECYRRHGRETDTEKLARAIARLEAELARIQAKPRTA